MSESLTGPEKRFVHARDMVDASRCRHVGVATRVDDGINRWRKVSLTRVVCWRCCGRMSCCAV